MSLLTDLYLRFFISSGFQYARYLKKKKTFHSQGENCFISKAADIPDPHLTSLGANVWITAGCRLLCHDASVIMINIMRHGHLDQVGPIAIGNNSFLGNDVIVLPHIAIGANTIIGTGSVVTKDIPENTVWAGNPARFITTLDDYIRSVENKTERYPWKDLLKKNAEHVYDPELEKQLKQERRDFFFPA